jgi:polyisoprenoid-binding protein YceI
VNRAEMTRYRILAGRSKVETEMTSNVHPIHATAAELSGVIEGELGPDGRPDFESPHRARFLIPVESLKSGNRLQDAEMQRRMDARGHPNIEVTVSRAWREDGDGRSRAKFEVEAHGRARPYEGEFTFALDGKRVIVEGEHAFDMRDFGVDPPRFLTLKVDPEVKVTLRIEAEEDGMGGQG